MKRVAIRSVALIMAVSWLLCHAGLAECLKAPVECCGQVDCEISPGQCGLMIGQAAKTTLEAPASTDRQVAHIHRTGFFSLVKAAEGRVLWSSINIRLHPPTGPPRV